MLPNLWGPPPKQICILAAGKYSASSIFCLLLLFSVSSFCKFSSGWALPCQHGQGTTLHLT